MSSYCQTKIDFIEDDLFTCISHSDGFTCVGSENGAVNIYDSKLAKIKWSAHKQAIFDLKWRVGHPGQLVTTSGDLSIKMWDLKSFDTGPAAVYENSHLSTVKSLSFCDSTLLATGARDGHIKLWDLREAPSPVCIIQEAHKLKLAGSKRPRKGQITRSNPLSSVTCVLFKPDSFSLFSSAAGDPKIHLWDIRKTSRPAVEYTGQARNGQGYSNLAVDASGRLYAACSDNNVYAFDKQANLICKLNHPRYSSSSNNMSKIRIMDDCWLVAGSAKESILIWSLDAIRRNESPSPRFILKEMDEVIGLEVDSSSYQLFSCCSESIHRWMINRLSVSKQTCTD